MASVPAWSTRSLSPLPAAREAAIAACSVTRTVSSTSARSISTPGACRRACAAAGVGGLGSASDDSLFAALVMGHCGRAPAERP